MIHSDDTDRLGTDRKLNNKTDPLALRGSWWVTVWNSRGNAGGGRDKTGGRTRISKCKCERYSRCRGLAAPLIFCGKNCKVLGLHPAPPDTASHKTYSSYNHISANSLTRRTITLHFTEMWEYFGADTWNCSRALRGGRAVESLGQTQSRRGRNSSTNGFLGKQTNRKCQIAKILTESLPAALWRCIALSSLPLHWSHIPEMFCWWMPELPGRFSNNLCLLLHLLLCNSFCGLDEKRLMEVFGTTIEQWSGPFPRPHTRSVSR